VACPFLLSLGKVANFSVLYLRETGETNMFDVPQVHEIARREGFFELLDYLAADTAGYSRFILTGREDIQ